MIDERREAANRGNFYVLLEIDARVIMCQGLAAMVNCP